MRLISDRAQAEFVARIDALTADQARDRQTLEALGQRLEALGQLLEQSDRAREASEETARDLRRAAGDAAETISRLTRQIEDAALRHEELRLEVRALARQLDWERDGTAAAITALTLQINRFERA